MLFDRSTVVARIVAFSNGKLDVLDIQNPIWYPGNDDLLDMKLESDITLGQVIVSIEKHKTQGATVTNSPTVKVYRQLVTKLQQLINHIRTKYPEFKTTYSSVFRSPFVDKQVGGSGGGPHTRGWAADCQFSGIEIAGRDMDSIRRGIAYEAYKLGIKGIELILDKQSVHFDAVRIDLWISEQIVVSEHFEYPTLDPNKVLKPYVLPAFAA